MQALLALAVSPGDWVELFVCVISALGMPIGNQIAFLAEKEIVKKCGKQAFSSQVEFILACEGWFAFAVGSVASVGFTPASSAYMRYLGVGIAICAIVALVYLLTRGGRGFANSPGYLRFTYLASPLLLWIMRTAFAV